MITRRRFLRGLGGATLALPMLESIRFATKGLASSAQAQSAPNPVYSVFVRQGNGVQQALSSRGEPERFWPRELGTLSRELLADTNSDRTVSELADYADDLLMVRGTRYGFSGQGCGHSGGINQCLTASRVTGSGKDSLADGESIDWRLSKEFNPPGIEPLTLMSGPQQAYLAAGLSYRGPQQLRGAQNNPFSVYQDLVGLGEADADLLRKIATRRQSVNDLVRDEMKDLMGKSYLGAADKQRLQNHFEVIRDMELGLVCTLGDSEVQAMESMAEGAADNDNRIAVAKLHMDLIAFAFACDLNRTATLQIGTGNDVTRYYVDGVRQNTYHRISHRIDDDGAEGPPIPDADILHHKIDRQFAQMFKYLLDRLSAYGGPSGERLLDDTVALWTNDLASGPPHSYRNLPQIIAGRAGGFLATGQYIDAGDVTHNKMLNTIMSAVGMRNDDGSYYDRFGDAELERGVIDAMIA
ncbi:DUF1552 domain-containing protein [Haliangium ochraceum]|uniref:Secreted protein containing DUF1552 n=1 Tax=Haliangium ochraceum (strain DSM 14365 / JCM 11303 / SMP-2) TaxID=502025 RepID=D0LJT6_HALO1|nr:DUF1552 domain-containing protein [Haliangium ochraceum]ACY18443.1 protein of unknown function DUF1552 [Haliangium ochraceum DSM 14365]